MPRILRQGPPWDLSWAVCRALYPGMAGASLFGLKRLLDYFHATPVFIDDALDIISIHPFLRTFIGGFFNILAVQGFIILILGILVFILSRFICFRPRTEAAGGSGKAAHPLMAPVFKAAAILALGAAFYLALRPQLNILAEKAENIKIAAQASHGFYKNEDLLEAVAELTGADFLKDIDKAVEVTGE